MKVKKVLEICRKNNHPISKARLYVLGRKYGFLEKTDGVTALGFDEEAFYRWLNKSFLENIPEGFISIKDFKDKHKEFNYSLSTLYSYAKSRDVRSVRRGYGKGIIYVSERELVNYIRKCKDFSYGERDCE